MEQYRGTTICSVRRGNQVVMGGDGQVTLGNTVMKSNARKVRRMYKGHVIAGFAGATADAFTLFERFEGKLNVHDIFAIPMTQAYICITLILFRSDSLATSGKVFLQLFNFDATQAAGAYAPHALFLTIALAVLWCLHYLRHQATFVPFWRNSPAPVFAVTYGAMFAVAITLRAINYQPFIYFQF